RRMNPIILRQGIGRARVSEASLERLRKFLLPLELAEAELKAKPAAAVMASLRDGPRGLEVLLGERTKREGDPWSGQIGLPGGRHRDEDPTMLATALRETKEEVGIDLEGRAEILGHMPPRAPGNKPEVLVVPYVALATEPIEATPGPEMASVFWVPLEALRGATAETTSLSVGFSVSSIRRWASRPEAVRVSRR